MNMNDFVDIPGWEGIYKINRAGQILGLGRWVNSNGGSKMYIPEKVLSSYPDKRSYLKIRLTLNGERKSYLVHRLIALVFIPNPNNHPIVRHLNDIPNDNRIENLAWGDLVDNTKDSMRNGTFKSIERHGKNNFSYGKRGEEAIGYGRKHIPVNKKKLVDTETGIIYNSIKEAADSICISYCHLSNMLAGRYNNRTNFKLL